MGLTLEEQERRAYISGDTERAALLAALVDGDERIAELDERIAELDERICDPKVLEQALEALEASRAYVDPHMRTGHDIAIRALRGMLA